MPVSLPPPEVMTRVAATLKKPDTILLIGAGVSQASGLPGWNALIQELLEYRSARSLRTGAMFQAVESGDLLLAANYGLDGLSASDFEQFVRHACKHGLAQPNSLHRLILQLGPTCFATTNYDQLLELAFRRYGIPPPRIVLNTDIMDLPDIVQAGATRFLLKYHGDIERPGSIVLSREHYRDLSGSARHVAAALELLIATRPLVMIGYGLRDFDFLMIKERLAATFGAGFGEHYAILPDVETEAHGYWRDNYGIELVGYETVRDPGGAVSHEGLQQLLEALIGLRATSPPAVSPSELLRRLGRYGNRLAKRRDPGKALPLSVREKGKRVSYPLEEILTSPRSLALIGRPGAGKSFSLRAYASSQAAALVEACLEDKEPEAILRQGALVPFVVNLALYAGDLARFLQEQLPVGLPMDQVLSLFSGVVVLDGVDELPQQFLDDETFIRDLEKLLAAFPQARLILSGRAGSWTDTVSMPQYEVEPLAADAVVEHFRTKLGPYLDTRPELVNTLRTPLFFKMANERIDITTIEVPSDIYRAFFGEVQARWTDRCAEFVDLQEILSNVAFDIITEGQEYFTVEDLEAASLKSGVHSALSPEVSRFLVEEAVLELTSERRLYFFHRSLTEYLAANALAQRATLDPTIITTCLERRRWDEPLFYALTYLPKALADRLFRELTAVDLTAAMRATHHLRERRSDAVQALLSAMAQNPSDVDFTFCDQFRKLSFSDIHIPALQRLADLSGAIGGLATGALVRVEPTTRGDCVERLWSSIPDKAYASELGKDLEALLEIADLRRFLALASAAPSGDESYRVVGRRFSHIPFSERISVCEEFVEAGGAVPLLFGPILYSPDDFDELAQGTYFLAKLAHGGVTAVMDSLCRGTLWVIRWGSVPKADADFCRIFTDAVRREDSMSERAAHVLFRLAKESVEWRDLIFKASLGDSFNAALSLWNEQDEAARMKHLNALIELLPDMRQFEITRSFSQELIGTLSDNGIGRLIETRHPTILWQVALHSLLGISKYRDHEWWLDTAEALFRDARPDAANALSIIATFVRTAPGFKDALKERLYSGRGTPEVLLDLAAGGGLTTDDLPEELVEQILAGTLAVRDSVLSEMATEALIESRVRPLWQAAAEGSPHRERLGRAIIVANQRRERGSDRRLMRH